MRIQGGEFFMCRIQVSQYFFFLMCNQSACSVIHVLVRMNALSKGTPYQTTHQLSRWLCRNGDDHDDESLVGEYGDERGSIMMMPPDSTEWVDRLRKDGSPSHFSQSQPPVPCNLYKSGTFDQWNLKMVLKSTGFVFEETFRVLSPPLPPICQVERQRVWETEDH